MPVVADRYEIVRELDRGGMGQVLLARQRNLGRLVVIKRVLDEHPQQYVDALREEALLSARLVHPNIVSVLDVSEPGERAFVAMEYVPGLSLRELISHARSGLPVDVALTIAIDVLRGLAYAHEVEHGESVGVVHRDVKPRNVMVTFAGVTKLIDFGISRWLAKDGSHEVTSVSGTHGYMAPEQADPKRLGGRGLDARIDEYAAGITLREMLTGAPPDEIEARKPRGTIEPELAALIAKATAEDREQRFGGCSELADALAAYAKATRIDVAPIVVERWMERAFPERIAQWERDLERASVPNVGEASTIAARHTSPTVREKREVPTVADSPSARRTVSEGERIEKPQSPRRAPWIIAGAAVVVAGGTYFATRSSDHADVPLTIEVAATASDPALGLAVENVTRRALRDAPGRRFWVGRDATMRIAITVATTAKGITLEARGEGVHAEATGASVYDAVGALAPQLVSALGADREDPGPDAHERERMTRLGARTFEQFRRFRILFEEVREPGWFDTTDAIARYEELVAEDPAWGHPYAELNWLYGRSTPKAKALVAAAKAKVDPTRGGGLALIQGLDFAAHRTRPSANRAFELAEPVFRADNEDLLAGEIVNSAHLINGREDDAAAVTRRQYELTPWLFYAGDVSDNLQKAGRVREAEQLIRDTLARYPESLTAARELARMQSRSGDVAAARATAQRMQLIHGDRAVGLAELYEAMLAGEDLNSAQRIADRMLRGSELSQVRGRYRVAVIAVFEGRFAAAYRAALQAYEAGAKFGNEAERNQLQQLLTSVGPLVGETEAAATMLDNAAASWDGVGDHVRGAWLRYRAVYLRDGRCPDPELLSWQGQRDDRVLAGALRAAALEGCADCKQVVDAGFQISETSAASLVGFGRCARKTGELALARRAFERATSMWSSWNNADASPYHAVLAYFELGRTLVELGDKTAARVALERFVRAWAHADRAVPEVAEAEKLLRSL